MSKLDEALALPEWIVNTLDVLSTVQIKAAREKIARLRAEHEREQVSPTTRFFMGWSNKQKGS